jgi:phage shock protein C
MAKKFYRSRTERMIGGVCGGLAEYFNIDPTVVRLAAVALTLAGGSGVLAYLIFWLVVPQQPLNLSGDEKKPESSGSGESSVDRESTDAGTAALFFGVLLTVLGFLFLVGNFISFAWLSFSRLWPLILIAIGIIIVLKGTGKKQNAN